MATQILIKHSTTAGSVPTTSDLTTGEFAVNTADKRVYTNNQGTIVELGTYPSLLNVTGNTDLDGTLNVDGNTTLASGSVTGNWTVSGTLSIQAPVNDTDAATKVYVDTKVSEVLDAAPEALNTLNELAAAINDDANFAATMTTALGAKLNLSGGTMTGNIDMGANKVITTSNPTTDDDLARKGYVDTILGSSTDAATSAASAATSAANAANSETAAAASALAASNSAGVATLNATSSADSASNAANSATAAANSATASATSATEAAASASNAAGSATSAQASLDEFQGQYHGALATAPTVGVDAGDLYFDTTANEMRVYDGSIWKATGSAVNGTSNRESFTATEGQTVFTLTSGYDANFADVYLNGVKLVNGVDVDVTSGVGFTLTVGATAGDNVDFIGYGAFVLADHYTKAEVDSTYGSEGRTQSSTDTTAGRLLKVGDFGIGAGDILFPTANGQDFNTVSARGNYSIITSNFSGILNAPPAYGYGTMLVTGGNTFYTQVYYPHNISSPYYRTYYNGTWDSWKKIYSTNSVVGTVSQSGGVPTGAIIERGSNANGEYVKYADGTLVEWTIIASDLGSPINTSGAITNFNMGAYVTPSGGSWGYCTVGDIHGRSLGGGGNRCDLKIEGRFTENCKVHRPIGLQTNTTGTTTSLVCQHIVLPLVKFSRWY
jgi:hypothetical protein